MCNNNTSICKAHIVSIRAEYEYIADPRIVLAKISVMSDSSPLNLRVGAVIEKVFNPIEDFIWQW